MLQHFKTHKSIVSNIAGNLQQALTKHWFKGVLGGVFGCVLSLPLYVCEPQQLIAIAEKIIVYLAKHPFPPTALPLLIGGFHIAATGYFWQKHIKTGVAHPPIPDHGGKHTFITSTTLVLTVFASYTVGASHGLTWLPYSIVALYIIYLQEELLKAILHSSAADKHSKELLFCKSNCLTIIGIVAMAIGLALIF